MQNYRTLFKNSCCSVYCGKSLFVSRTLFMLLVILINRSCSYKKKLNRNLLSNSKAARVLSMAGDRYPSVTNCAWFQVLDLSLEWELFYSHVNNLRWNLMANWQLCLRLFALKISGYQASVLPISIHHLFDWNHGQKIPARWPTKYANDYSP